MSQKPPSSAGRSVRPAVLVKLAAFGVLSALIVAGPYLALVFGFPWLAREQGWFVQITPERIAASLNPTYWLIMGIYVGLATIFSPTHDPENLGLFGNRWVDNPFSYQDDYNRTMRSWRFSFTREKSFG